MKQATLYLYTSDTDVPKYTDIVRTTTMHSKLVAGEITQRQYSDYLCQKRGFLDYTDYARKMGYTAYDKGNSNRVLKYQHTPKGFEVLKKHKLKRERNLGYNVLNPDLCQTEGFEGHHWDKENVVYIPRELHISVRHSIFSGKNMHLINEKASSWYLEYYGHTICF